MATMARAPQTVVRGANKGEMGGYDCKKTARILSAHGTPHRNVASACNEAAPAELLQGAAPKLVQDFELR